jgi:hypothetical protein
VSPQIISRGPCYGAKGLWFVDFLPMPDGYEGYGFSLFVDGVYDSVVSYS